MKPDRFAWVSRLSNSDLAGIGRAATLEIFLRLRGASAARLVAVEKILGGAMDLIEHRWSCRACMGKRVG